MTELAMIFLLSVQVCTTKLVTECRYRSVGFFELEDECHEAGRDWLKAEIVNDYKCTVQPYERDRK